MSKTDMLDYYNKFRNEEIMKIGKLLGKGAFGEVREITYKNKTFAGKLIKNENNQKTEEEKCSQEIRGQNIIRINKVFTKYIGGERYDLIIMEKAMLRDLGKLSDFYHQNKLLKLLNKPFDEIVGDTLIRFYAKQIVNALETLDRSNYVHFDLKPDNLLIHLNLNVKLCDFSLLRKVNNGVIKIPGGTKGYLTPEYYTDSYVSKDDAKKQDYFALGSTLFFLKYGQELLQYKKSDDKIINAYQIIDLLQQNISFIQSQKSPDREFIDFLCCLINYKPKDRPSFEQIYRNKWLNKNEDKLDEISSGFENDEEKLIMELQKKDFLIRNEKGYFLKDSLDNKIEFKDSLLREENDKIKEDKYNEPCRFRFRKKKKIKLYS